MIVLFEQAVLDPRADDEGDTIVTELTSAAMGAKLRIDLKIERGKYN